VLVLDSVPRSATELLNHAIIELRRRRKRIVQSLSRTAVNIYLFGNFDNRPTCDVANGVGNAECCFFPAQTLGL
jgi:hypothetical protein